MNATATADPNLHVTRPVVQQMWDTHAVVLCGFGHLIECIPLGEWARSAAEAKYGDPSCRVACRGALP